MQNVMIRLDAFFQKVLKSLVFLHELNQKHCFLTTKNIDDL